MSGMVDVDRLLFGKEQQVAPNAGGGHQQGGPVLNDNITMLTHQWRNEVHAPEILPYRNDLMDEVITNLKEQVVRYFVGAPYPILFELWLIYLFVFVFLVVAKHRQHAC
jgi:hypothetical protein